MNLRNINIIYKISYLSNWSLQNPYIISFLIPRGGFLEPTWDLCLHYDEFSTCTLLTFSFDIERARRNILLQEFDLSLSWFEGCSLHEGALTILSIVMPNLAIITSSEFCIVLNFWFKAFTFVITSSIPTLLVRLIYENIANPHLYWASQTPLNIVKDIGWSPFKRDVFLCQRNSTSISSWRGSLFNYEACTNVARWERTSDIHTYSYTVI